MNRVIAVVVVFLAVACLSAFVPTPSATQNSLLAASGDLLQGKGKPAPRPPCGGIVNPVLPLYPAYFTIADEFGAGDPPPVFLTDPATAYNLQSDDHGIYQPDGKKVPGGRDSLGIEINCNALAINLLNSVSRSIPATLLSPPRGAGDLFVPYMVVWGVGTVPVAGTTAYSSFCASVDSTPFYSDAGGLVHDNFGGCGTDDYGDFVRRAAFFRLADEEHRDFWAIQFNHYPKNAAEQCGDACDGTAYVRVYHPDADTWVLAPEFKSELVPWTAAILEQTEAGNYGSYVPIGLDSVPFKVTVKMR
jgi:hypothetical protein